MKVQEGHRADGRRAWLLLDEEYRPVEPVLNFLRYLDSVERSPNTLRAYAFDLQLYWEFLADKALDWREVCLEDLAAFILWLRAARHGVIPIDGPVAVRTEKTTNRILGTLTSFYEFQERNAGPELALRSQRQRILTRYKGLLHHAKRSAASKQRILKLKEPRRFPGCLTDDQVKLLISKCKNLQERLLLCTLTETGLRIGELLQLRHEDMETGARNAVHVIPRNDSMALTRAKGRCERQVDVSIELMRLYSRYLVEEYPEVCDCDYVFVRSSLNEEGAVVPLSYSSVNSLFQRLRRQTGIHVTPHLFRHTHATELIRAGWNVAFVQNRLGHAQIQTTVNTYTHLTISDLDSAYRSYLDLRRDKHGSSEAHVNS